MGMLDNLFRLCRMSDVIVQFLLQIGKVILNLNIVIIGNQLSLHKPGFTGRTRHYGNGVGRHYPFQIGGDIVTLERHDKFIIKMLTDCFLGSHPLLRITFVPAHHAAIANG